MKSLLNHSITVPNLSDLLFAAVTFRALWSSDSAAKVAIRRAQAEVLVMSLMLILHSIPHQIFRSGVLYPGRCSYHIFDLH